MTQNEPYVQHSCVVPSSTWLQQLLKNNQDYKSSVFICQSKCVIRVQGFVGHLCIIPIFHEIRTPKILCHFPTLSPFPLETTFW